MEEMANTQDPYHGWIYGEQHYLPMQSINRLFGNIEIALDSGKDCRRSQL